MNYQLEIQQSKVSTIFRHLRESMEVDGKPCSLRKLEQLMFEKLGKTVSNSHISEIELSKREPSLNELLIYHKFFNISLEELLGDEFDVPITSICQRLNSLRSDGDIAMYELLLSLADTDKGMALLYYLSEYLNSKASPDTFLRQMSCLKDNNFSPIADYQMIRATVDESIK